MTRIGWWKRLSGEPRSGTSPTVEAVRLDLSIPIVEQTSHRTAWRDADGDVVSVDVVEDLGLPDSLTPGTVQAFFREMAEAHQGGLIEAQLLEWRSGAVMEGIYKCRQGSGFVFTGLLMMPMRLASLVWTQAAGERGMTGIREAVIAARMLQAGSLTPEVYEHSWAQDPYDSGYRALGRVDFRTLRYTSDDTQFDSHFPNHPLSKIRSGVQKILADAEVDERVFGSVHSSQES